MTDMEGMPTAIDDLYQRQKMQTLGLWIHGRFTFIIGFLSQSPGLQNVSTMKKIKYVSGLRLKNFRKNMEIYQQPINFIFHKGIFNQTFDDKMIKLTTRFYISLSTKIIFSSHSSIHFQYNILDSIQPHQSF